MPSLSSSPRILGAPQSGFSKLILRIRSRTSLAIRGRPPSGRDFHRQYAAKPIRCQRTTVSGLTMIDPTQMQSPWRALLQDIELMPQHQDFGFQLLSRLEEVAQHADEQEAHCKHAAIMF